MSDALNRNAKKLLILSVATNIFLVAFVLGRCSAPSGPPHGFGGPDGMRHEMGGMPPMHGPHPFFGPDALFAPDELKANEDRMHQDFDKVNALRHDFATQLDAGAVSKDDVLKHFAAIDQIMDNVRKETQDKAAEKISTLPEADRHKFAETLLSHEADRGPPPPHD